MSRRIEPSALSRVVTDAVRDHLEAVVARYLPHPERRTTPLALVVALVNAVAAQVGKAHQRVQQVIVGGQFQHVGAAAR